jgi:hypothetical protein
MSPLANQFNGFSHAQCSERFDNQLRTVLGALNSSNNVIVHAMSIPRNSRMVSGSRCIRSPFEPRQSADPLVLELMMMFDLTFQSSFNGICKYLIVIAPPEHIQVEGPTGEWLRN